MAKTNETITEEIIQDGHVISMIQTGTKVWNDDKEAFIHDNDARVCIKLSTFDLDDILDTDMGKEHVKKIINDNINEYATKDTISVEDAQTYFRDRGFHLAVDDAEALGRLMDLVTPETLAKMILKRYTNEADKERFRGALEG